MSTNSILQALLDVRSFPEGARTGLTTLQAGGIMQITSPDAPPLAAGNIWLMCSDGNTLICDYRTIDGLLTLAMGDELRQRIAMMRTQNDSGYCYIIYSGLAEKGNESRLMVDGKNTNMAWRSWQGVLHSCQENGAIVMPIDRPQDLGGVLNWLGCKNRETGKMLPLRENEFYSAGEAMLLAIPQLGRTRLDKLMQFTRGNVGYALAALTDPLMDLSSIGIPKVVQIEARKALHCEEGFCFGMQLVGEHLEGIDV